jgi:ribonucleoside-diphosphate reductase subunit M2
MLNMHNEMYASLMDVYLPGSAAQAQLIAETEAKPAAQKKTTWCQQWMDSKASFGLRLVAFAAVQSVMHAGTFASFYKMGERNLLSGLKHVSYFPSSLIIPALRLRFVPTPPHHDPAP